MARKEIPTIGVAVRSFGNERSYEGHRVKAGTRFAIETPIEGMTLMRLKRFESLERSGHVRVWGKELDLKAAPPARRAAYEQNAVLAQANADVEKGAARPAKNLSPTIRAAARRRAQAPDPPAPQRLNPAPASASSHQEDSAPTGSQTGQNPTVDAASSSQVAPLLKTSIFRRRGTRQG